MSQSKKAIKAGIGYTIGNYLLKGLTFFSIPIFSRLMSTQDYGLYNTFVAYESIVFVFVGLALHSSFKNGKYKYQERFNSFISACLTVGLISFCVWVLLANIFYPIYAQLFGFSRLVVNLLLVCSMGSAIIQYFNVYLSIDYRYDKFLKISAFNAIASILLSVVLIKFAFPNASFFGRILGTAIPMVMISAYIIRNIYINSRPNLEKEFISYSVKFSLPIIPHGISQVILSQFDRIMINSIIGAAEAGIYSFSYNIYTIIQVTSSSIDNVWGPWFFENANKNKYREIEKVSSVYISLMMLFSSLVILVSPEIIKLLSPQSYWDSMYAVVPVVIGGFFAFLYTLPVQVEYYFEKTKYIAIGTCSAALLNMLLNLIFIPLFGYIAAAYTTLVTYLCYFIFHYLLAIKFAERNYFSTRIIVLNIVGIILIGVFTLLSIDYAVYRIGFAIIYSIVVASFVQIKFKIFNILASYVKNRRL